MSASILMIVAIVSLSIGYVVYGRFVTRKYGLDPNRKTPAHTKRDDVDYVPTKAPVLMGSSRRKALSFRHTLYSLFLLSFD